MRPIHAIDFLHLYVLILHIIIMIIPIHLDIAPQDGANKPDIMVMDMKKEQWILIEGTVQRRMY